MDLKINVMFYECKNAIDSSVVMQAFSLLKQVFSRLSSSGFSHQSKNIYSNFTWHMLPLSSGLKEMGAS
jgi:hypothetical protein